MNKDLSRLSLDGLTLRLTRGRSPVTRPTGAAACYAPSSHAAEQVAGSFTFRLSSIVVERAPERH